MKPTLPNCISLVCFLLCLFGLNVSVAAPPSAHAAADLPFRAAYTLDLQMVLTPPFANITSTGTATGTHVGQATARSVEETVNLATGEGVATHEFTAANGDAILVNFLFTALPTSETDFVVNGTWEISGGTGRFEDTTGSGSYSGQVQFTSPLTATARFEMKGTMSVPGAVK